MILKDKSLAGYHAVRNSVAISLEDKMFCIKIVGNQALDVMDRICPCDLFLYNTQIKHTFLLKDNGIPFADIYACRDGENGIILGYGPTFSEVSEWLEDSTKDIKHFSITDMMESHRIISLDGPYSWELCSEILSNDILALPYLSLMSTEDYIVFRCGKTGEYGYHLMIPKDESDSWSNIIWEKGINFQISEADEESKFVCSTENFFFDIYREGQSNLSPFELQQQWRLSRKKIGYPGSEAVEFKRKNGWDERITCFISENPIESDQVSFGKEAIGKVILSAYSPTLEKFIGKALVKKPFWHSGLDDFNIGGVNITTVSAPMIYNLSLSVSPYSHSFYTKTN